jgi:hypothetical protein
MTTNGACGLSWPEIVQAKSKERRKALKEMLDVYDGVDNGHCRVCRGYRLFRMRKGKITGLGKCENEECPSHRWRKALRDPR